MPFPVCPGADVIVINDAFVNEVHTQALPVVTFTLIAPPLASTLTVVLEIVNVQLAVGAVGLIFEQLDNNAAAISTTTGKR